MYNKLTSVMQFPSQQSPSKFIWYTQHFCHCWKHCQTDFLELYVGWYINVPKFQNILETMLPLLQFHSPKQERVTRDQIRQVRRLQDHSHISNGQKLLLHLSLSNLCTNFTDICHTPKSSTRIIWHISHDRPNLAGNFKTVLSLVYVKDFVNILQIFVCVICGRMTWTLTSFQQNFPVWIEANSQKPKFSPQHVTKSYCEYFVHFRFSFPKPEVKHNTNALFLHKTIVNCT